MRERERASAHATESEPARMHARERSIHECLISKGWAGWAVGAHGWRAWLARTVGAHGWRGLLVRTAGADGRRARPARKAGAPRELRLTADRLKKQKQHFEAQLLWHCVCDARSPTCIGAALLKLLCRCCRRQSRSAVVLHMGYDQRHLAATTDSQSSPGTPIGIGAGTRCGSRGASVSHGAPVPVTPRRRGVHAACRPKSLLGWRA
jgi:hypothetical protein